MVPDALNACTASTVGWIAVFYALMGVGRLVYFTLDKTPIPGFFKGLPTPAGAMLVLASVLRLGVIANFISAPVLTGFKAGIGLVILVIFLFLGSVRATLVPAVTVPISLVATFLVLWLLLAAAIATGGPAAARSSAGRRAMFSWTLTIEPPTVSKSGVKPLSR